MSQCTEADMPCTCEDLKAFDKFEDFLLSNKDYAYTLAWAVALTFARIYVQRFFSQVAKRTGIEQTHKFAESCWKLIFYVISWTCGMALLYDAEWFPNTTLCWKTFPTYTVSGALKLYYLFELGFYAHSLYAHLFIEVKRSDFWALLAHHIVTILLIYFSYLIKFYRIGLLVLLCHDFNDIFLELGKIFVYRKMKNAANVAFLILMVSWIVSRLAILPLVVLRSTLFESVDWLPCRPVPYYWPFNGGLITLFLLHIYWFGLMIRVAVRSIIGKGVDDPREKDD